MSHHDIVLRTMLRAALEERLLNFRVIDGVYVEKLAMLHGELSCSEQLASSREGALCRICRRHHGEQRIASPSECANLRNPNPRVWIPASRPDEAGYWVPPHQMHSPRRSPRNLPIRMPRRFETRSSPRRPPPVNTRVS